MKLKLLILKIILILSFFSNSSFAKNLPPGSGISDVPANVLILLDKSGSMSVRMTSGAGFSYPYSVATDSSGDVYVGQYWVRGIKKFTYSTKSNDTSFASSGTYRGSGNCRSYYPLNMKVHNNKLYVASYYQRRVFRIDLTSGSCDWNQFLNYPRNISIAQNTLYATGNGGMLTYNISGATPSQISCSWSGNLSSYARYYGQTADYKRENYYVHYSRYIYRYTIGSNGCINTNYSSRSYVGNWYYSYGMDHHPSNELILYGSDWRNHRVTKVTLNTSRNGYTAIKNIGRYGRNASKTGNVRMYGPWGVTVDKTNNRVLSTSYYKQSVNAFDLDLNFDKEFGGSAGTRMTGAHEAIQSIVTDSSLTAGVNFGFGYWSWDNNGSGFRSWSGDITNGRATPCTSRACIKVRAHKQGAAKINSIIKSVQPGGGTNADNWAKQAEEYYLHSTLSPIDKNLTCQNSYVLVIGDGDWYNHNGAARRVSKLLNSHKIKTFTVAYGTGLSNNGVRNFNRMAQTGGTNSVIVARTTQSLKTQLKAAISQIIAQKLSFSAPAITATIEQGGSLYQAQFDYEQNKEWKGTLKSTAIDSNGVVGKKNWDAAELLEKRNTDDRKIWTHLPNTSANSGYSGLNNWVTSNYKDIDKLFTHTNNEVPNYHSKSDNPTNTQRCKNVASVQNDNEDDIKGLIQFVRGQDYFDYDGDCNLTETRPNPLGDIYHSELVVVSKPSAETAFAGRNQESYWRSLKNYSSFAQKHSSRKETVYVGANDGMLHAFDGKTGKEIWAFVPPFIASSMPNMVNVNLNRSGVGGSNAIYGVDGSVTAHDMFYKGPYDSKKEWHTILMVPYGRGGAGFSVLDISDRNAPMHLYSVLNDGIQTKVHVMDHNGTISSYDYIKKIYDLASFFESITVSSNNKGDLTCKSDQSTDCQESNVWTLDVPNLSKSDVSILIDDKPFTNFTVKASTITIPAPPSGGQAQTKPATEITLQNKTLKFYGSDPCASNPNAACNKESSNMALHIKPGSAQTGVLSQPEYDYSELGGTWSSPRIIRMPNKGPGDNNLEDDIYVAIMGGGYGVQNSGVGSNLTIVNLEDTTFPGKLEKRIDIEDMLTNDIVNSTPGSPVVITADTARGIDFRGALVYISDLEGKITKFNLTNNRNDGTGKALKMYDSTTLFKAGSNQTNGRYMYHSMDATIGQTTNSLWLYAGTGDYERIGNTSNGTDNLMIGIRDPHYPEYRDVAVPKKAADLTKCKNTTKDKTGNKCPTSTDTGWYIKLDKSQKVTAEPTVSSGLVYFPIYQPTSSVNKCSLGDAFICGVDDECGTNFSSKLKNLRRGDTCKYVGQGVLSKIVVFAGKLFANIAGQSAGSIKDLVSIEAAAGGTSSYRSSWRQNY